MKKSLFLLLIILTVASSHGQDTITENNSCYLFHPHTSNLMLYDSNDIIHWSGNIWWENIASPGTMLYGVSIRGELPLDSSVYAVLAIKENNQYIFLDTAWYDSSVVYRYLRFRASNNYFEFDYGENCNEIYFHRPWQLNDTFYVIVCHAPLVSVLDILVRYEPGFTAQRWYQTREGDSIETPPYLFPLPGSSGSCM
jgi:hypothetical protein